MCENGENGRRYKEINDGNGRAQLHCTEWKSPQSVASRGLYIEIVEKLCDEIPISLQQFRRVHSVQIAVCSEEVKAGKKSTIVRCIREMISALASMQCANARGISLQYAIQIHHTALLHAAEKCTLCSGYELLGNVSCTRKTGK